ncbi:hypothetical protein BXZ70DRAFT_554534 [Cristinia sonorae]|uniref:Uncharacterized protein n=1 Tax=Cristinia sonorae TaxID=1940300 RepID=A0A8K0UHV2_9AGAR|nr:hypothetical protein BXZ70DRAFT_554534 [Cristinia sonorae]
MADHEHHWFNDDARTNLVHAESQIRRKVRGAWSGFLEFALRDNVLEVAVGLIIASTFTAVVNSLVSDILLPPISLLPFMARNLEEKFWLLRKGPHWAHGYNTRKQAIDDGAVIMTYGCVWVAYRNAVEAAAELMIHRAFLDKLVSFVGVGLALYFLATLYGFFSKDSIIKHTMKCAYCKKEISQKAKRCPMCTTWLDGREEAETSALAHR